MRYNAFQLHVTLAASESPVARMAIFEIIPSRKVRWNLAIRLNVAILLCSVRWSVDEQTITIDARVS